MFGPVEGYLVVGGQVAAALIYQHAARGADQRITDAIDFHVQAERDDQGDDDNDGPAGMLVPAG